MLCTAQPFRLLACPMDGEPLSLQEHRWTCSNNHSFDIARQGYVHLLPVQSKRSKDPGDSKEMVASRQRFLNSGAYLQIAKAVSQKIQSFSSGFPLYSCLDAGCGEGYYLRQISKSCESGNVLELSGLDISKWAVLSAAKQDKQPQWVVGSNAKIPALSSSLDSLLCIFGFPVYAEFLRVLKPGAKLIQVDAGPQHLTELRQIIYPSLKVKEDKETLVEGFELLSNDSITFPLELDSSEKIHDLLSMTPHFYRADKAGREKAMALTSLTLTVDVTLKCYAAVKE